MKIKLQCFHPSEDEDKLGEVFDMEEMTLAEFDRFVFRCPDCGKETFLIYEVETPYSKGSN